MPNLYISNVVSVAVRDRIISTYQRVYGEDKIYVDPVERSKTSLDNLANREIPQAELKLSLPLVAVEDQGVALLMATKSGVHFMRTPPYVTNVDPYPPHDQNGIQLDQILSEDGIGLAYAGSLLDEIRLLENFVTPDTQKASENGLREIPLDPTLSYEDRVNRVSAYLDNLRPYLLTVY